MSFLFRAIVDGMVVNAGQHHIHKSPSDSISIRFELVNNGPEDADFGQIVLQGPGPFTAPPFPIAVQPFPAGGVLTADTVYLSPTSQPIAVTGLAANFAPTQPPSPDIIFRQTVTVSLQLQVPGQVPGDSQWILPVAVGAGILLLVVYSNRMAE